MGTAKTCMMNERIRDAVGEYGAILAFAREWKRLKVRERKNVPPRPARTARRDPFIDSCEASRAESRRAGGFMFTHRNIAPLNDRS